MRKICLSIITVVFAFAFTGCDLFNSDEPTVVKGRIDQQATAGKIQSNGDQVASTSFSSVTAGRIESDGSVDMMSDTETDISSDGTFQLEIDGSSSNHYVLVADNGSQKLRGYITGELDNGSTIETKPLSTESTAEAGIYSRVIAEGEAVNVNYANVEASIHSRSAAHILGDARIQSELARGFIAEYQSRASYYNSDTVDVNTSNIETANESKMKAVARLSSNLYDANSGQDVTTSYEAYMEAMVDSYSEAGVASAIYTKMRSMSSVALVKNAAAISSETENEIRTQNALITSIAMDEAVRAQFERINASSSTMSSLNSAGAGLQDSLKAGIQSESSIEAAFTSYHDTVVELLDEESPEDAEVIVRIDQDINAESGAKAALESTLLNLFSVDLIVDAYADFNASVNTKVKAELSQSSETEKDASAEILALVNMNT